MSRSNLNTKSPLTWSETAAHTETVLWRCEEMKVQMKELNKEEETAYLLHFGAFREDVSPAQLEGVKRRESCLMPRQQRLGGFYLRQEAARTTRWPQRRQLTWQLRSALSSPSSSKWRNPRCTGREKCHVQIHPPLTVVLPPKRTENLILFS